MGKHSKTIALTLISDFFSSRSRQTIICSCLKSPMKEETLRYCSSSLSLSLSFSSPATTPPVTDDRTLPTTSAIAADYHHPTPAIAADDRSHPSPSRPPHVPFAVPYLTILITMEDNNANLNLELTLATGPTQNPNPVNPQIWATTGGHRQQPPVTNGFPIDRPRGRNGRFISVRPILPSFGPYSTNVSHRPQNARPFQTHGHPSYFHTTIEPTFFPIPTTQYEHSTSMGQWEAIVNGLLNQNQTTQSHTLTSNQTNNNTLICYERKRPKTRQLSVVINPVEENGQENMEHKGSPMAHKKGKGMVTKIDPKCDVGPSSREHIPQEILEKIERDVAARYHESNSQLQKEVMDLSVQVRAQKETIKNLEMTLELVTNQAPVVDQPTPLFQKPFSLVYVLFFIF